MGKTSPSAWKKFERRVAALFGCKRTPMSGISSGHTHSDSLHPTLFLECKLRATHSTMTLYRETAELAKKEGKVPVLALQEKHKPGFLLVIHCDDLAAFVEAWLERNPIPERLR